MQIAERYIFTAMVLLAIVYLLLLYFDHQETTEVDCVWVGMEIVDCVIRASQ
jgi:hypothetical protein